MQDMARNKKEDCPMNVSEIRGMKADVAAKFKAKGIATDEALLNAAKTPALRKELAAAVGLEAGAVLEFANRADLARVAGIGEVFADLLENAGVDTVKELSKRVPENLLAKITEVNTAKKLAGRLPTLDQVTGWVEQAKKLPKVLEY
jgi:predicted flap endonuclease-1-like 5' DNA nuclease